MHKINKDLKQLYDLVIELERDINLNCDDSYNFAKATIKNIRVNVKLISDKFDVNVNEYVEGIE